MARHRLQPAPSPPPRVCPSVCNLRRGQNEFLIFSGLTAVAALAFLAYLNMPK